MVYGKYKVKDIDTANKLIEDNIFIPHNHVISKPRRVVLSKAIFEDDVLIKEPVLSDYAIFDVLWHDKEHSVFNEFEQNLDDEGIIKIAGVSYLENKK